jgi:hypothetical protein
MCERIEYGEVSLTNNYVSTKVSAISTKKVKWDGREGEDKLDRGGRRMKWVVL